MWFVPKKSRKVTIARVNRDVEKMVDNALESAFQSIRKEFANQDMPENEIDDKIANCTKDIKVIREQQIVECHKLLRESIAAVVMEETREKNEIKDFMNKIFVVEAFSDFFEQYGPIVHQKIIRADFSDEEAKLAVSEIRSELQQELVAFVDISLSESLYHKIHERKRRFEPTDDD